MKRLILTLFLMATFETVQGQRNEVVAASGNYVKTATGSVSWTLGELATDTYRAQGKILTQGFQQSRTSLVTAVYSDAQGIEVYPNPAADQFYLHTDSPEGLSYRLHSLTGVVIDEQTITQPETPISLHGLAPAMYLLQVRRGAALVSIFRIVKR